MNSISSNTISLKKNVIYLRLRKTLLQRSAPTEHNSWDVHDISNSDSFNGIETNKSDLSFKKSDNKIGNFLNSSKYMTNLCYDQ